VAEDGAPAAGHEDETETTPEPAVPAAPVAAPTAPPAPAARGPVGWVSVVLLVIVVLLGVLLAVEWVHADAATIADEGWRNNAQWAAGVGVVLLGIALAVMAWTLALGSKEPVMARVAVVIAAVGVVGAVVVMGVADEQGGQLAHSSTPPVVTSTAAGEEGEPPPDEPLTLEEAIDPQNLTGSAIPIDVRTFVLLDLTQEGRRFVASAMSCRPADLSGREVSGYAIGGTWAQPLVVVNPPTTEDGDVIARCRRTILRLPQEAGIVGSG
jgi:hypothetical protein